jgi:uncharacterized membrane protein
MPVDWTRLWRHLTTSVAVAHARFPAERLARIEQAIREVGTRHDGQLRFAVEPALDLRSLLAGQTARERAVEVYSQLRVWDTEHNNGVLIYLLLADRDVEIVADRGVHARVGREGWEAVCRTMEAEFLASRFEEGSLAGVRAVGALLSTHYPRAGGGAAPADRPVPR